MTDSSNPQTASSSATSTATLDVSPEILTAGQPATVTYSDPSRAGQIIRVHIDDGGIPTPQEDHIDIQLDENGDGTGVWTVKNWDLANFNAPDAQQVTRPIVSG